MDFGLVLVFFGSLLMIILFRETRLNGSDFSECDIEVSRMAREFYFGESITEDDLQQFINLNSDVQFW